MWKSVVELRKSSAISRDRELQGGPRASEVEVMKRISSGLVMVAVLLAACANPPVVPSGGDESPSPTPSETSPRVAIYETMIRHLVDPKGAQSIYVVTKVCGMLLKAKTECPDPLSIEEQEALLPMLDDLGDIQFRNEDDPPLPFDEPIQEILLGPIVDKPDGLRVEGGSVCGGLCGTGSVYVLVETEIGYEVTGIDHTYGTWIA
jgi:hypothetical protein